MRKYIPFFAFGLLLLWAGYMAATYERTPDAQAPGSGQAGESPAPGTDGDWMTFASDAYGFSFQYPPDAQFADEPSFTFLDNPVAQLEIDRKAGFPNTNYAGERFVASFVPTMPEPQCFAFANGVESESGERGGLPYRMFETKEAGAGNVYESRVLRIRTEQGCLEAAATLHTTNIGNYEPGTVNEVDEASAWRTLERMLGSVTARQR